MAVECAQCLGWNLKEEMKCRWGTSREMNVCAVTQRQVESLLMRRRWCCCVAVVDGGQARAVARWWLDLNFPPKMSDTQ